MAKISQNIIEELKQNVLEKSKKQDEFVDTKNLYVVFLDDNTFKFCKEIQIEGKYCVTYRLIDYFNDVIVGFKVEFVGGKTKLPWRKSEVFESFDNEKLVAIPIKTLLGNHILKDVTTKKNIYNLYSIIDKYINENPYFIQNMFSNNREKVLKNK